MGNLTSDPRFVSFLADICLSLRCVARFLTMVMTWKSFGVTVWKTVTWVLQWASEKNDILQRNLDKFKKCASSWVGPVLVSIQFVGWRNWKSSGERLEKDLGVLVNENMDKSPVCLRLYGCTRSPENQSYPWLHQNQHDQQAKGGDSPPPVCLPPHWAPVCPRLKNFTYLYRPQYRKDIDLLKCIQRRACKMIGRMKQFSYE